MTRRTTINPDSVVLNPQKFIQKERADSKIKVDQVNTFLESSPERRTLTHALIDQIVNDPILKTDTDYYDAKKCKREKLLPKK